MVETTDGLDGLNDMDFSEDEEDKNAQEGSTRFA